MRFLVSRNGILLSSLGNIIYYAPRNIWTFLLHQLVAGCDTQNFILFTFFFCLPQDCTIIPAVFQSSHIGPLDLSLYKICNWFIHLSQSLPNTLFPILVSASIIVATSFNTPIPVLWQHICPWCVCVLHSVERHCVCTAQCREALCVYCTV